MPRKMKVTYRQVQLAVRGISFSLRNDNLKGARIYAADLLHYLYTLNLLPTTTEIPTEDDSNPFILTLTRKPPAPNPARNPDKEKMTPTL